ncbi:MAG: polysaccharide pyruvyl transferase CsaB [Candidatus Gastranaerophilales bacterium]|nr:polysaccharide pyruvyl transferase CsaB [Candidatus Gastranaerophilales bacterium]
MTKKICISGYYGFDNFGDETILKVLVENLKKFDCNPEITVFSSNPDKTSTRLNVKSVRSFDLFGVIKSLLKSDCLISGGGSLLQDVTSKKSLIYYLGVIGLAQLFGKKTIIFAQGIGPIKDKKLEKLTASILKRAKLITVRDDNSLKLLNSWGVNPIKCNDPVWNISVEQKNNTGKIGIQLRDFPTLTNEFIIELANSINKYFSEKEVCILSLQNHLDLDPCNKLKDELLKINSNINAKVIENISNDRVINDISNLEILIAMRFHACLIGLKAGVKVIPINYDIKVETLAKEFGLNTISLKNNEDIKTAIENASMGNSEKAKEKLFDFALLEENI